MNHYVTGTTIKELREKKGLTQTELGIQIGVSDKTISKWETMRGLPDLSLIEPLAKSLGISVVELLAGEYVTNQNVSSNMLRSRLYVCPVCGNVIHTMGESVISCHGIVLPVLEAEECDKEHRIKMEKVEDEQLITVEHDMSKKHYLSFLAYTTSNKYEMVKLYPEGNAETRFLIRGHGILYAYCNQHGLFQKRF